MIYLEAWVLAAPLLGCAGCSAAGGVRVHAFRYIVHVGDVWALLRIRVDAHIH